MTMRATSIYFETMRGMTTSSRSGKAIRRLLGSRWAAFMAVFILPLALPRSTYQAKEHASKRPPPLRVYRDTILRGQSLAAALSETLSAAAIHELVEAARPIYNLSSVLPGRSYGMALLPDGTLQTFTYAIDELKTLRVFRDDDGLSAAVHARRYETRVSVLSATIDSSLFESVGALGESDRLAFDFADIFSWDVDFNTDIRRGDAFEVAVEKLALDGRFMRYGRILAARLSRGDRTFTAVRFDCESTSGYFSPDGVPLRKAFLRSPLKYARITSRFSRARYHPILRIVRPHRGVDYAAPTGTPVMATADGVVITSGRLGGYGNTVRIRHANGYVTLYGHLSRIYVRAGRRVNQGQTVGAVGRTGMATGPHLDYRMTRNGVFVDPLTTQIPPAAPIPPHEHEAFETARARHMALLPVKCSSATSAIVDASASNEKAP
ncbi:MAG: M23 family metallopeptidase [Vicinamibacteria bacterium]|nr:M23 family metallopeptidase [Vicinamibacteria bacterium]